MPTYEYRCPNGHEFEKFYRSIAGAPTAVLCPSCGKLSERQLSGGAGLVFKGSGFYITDYGKDGKKSQTAPAGGGDTGASATETPGAKSDATPPAKTSDAKSSAPESAPPPKPGKKSKASE